MSDWTPRVAELEAMVMYACAEVERLTRERDEARAREMAMGDRYDKEAWAKRAAEAEVERLRAALREVRDHSPLLSHLHNIAVAALTKGEP